MSGSILVVGAGVAGRAVARALVARGLGCTVVEHRESAGLGTGLNLPGNAVRVLDELGVADQVSTLGVPVRRREYRNGRGRLLFAVDDEEFWRGVGQPVCVRHGHLLAALGLAARPERAHVLSADPGPEGVEVRIEGEPDLRRYDVVIGADGVHSTVRAAVDRASTTASSMTHASWRFVTANPGVDCWTVWSGARGTALLIPVEEGRVYGYAASTRGGTVGTDPAWLRQVFAQFPEPAARAIGSVLAGDGELRRDDVDEVRVPRWHEGRLLLVGDAAHATGPVWAQGAAMALEDAVTLAELLERTPSPGWRGVGAEFERLRRPRVEHVQRMTDKMSRIAALPGWVRDLSAPLLGPRTYREAYGPLRLVGPVA